MKLAHQILDPRVMWLSERAPMALLLKQALAHAHDARLECDEPTGAPMPWEVPLYTVDGGVAVVTVRGVMVRECDPIEAWVFGLCSTSRICEAIEKADADPAVAAIFLDIDSPGGQAIGTPECADVVAAARKPIAAWSGGLMASAAYWIGSHADYVAASKSAMVGSIGVITTVYDFTAMLETLGVKAEVFTDSPLKGIGMPERSLTDEQRAWLQDHVDELGRNFRAAISARMPSAKPDAMQGQVFIGASAQAAGLIHDLTTRAGAVAGLRAMTDSREQKGLAT